MGKEEMNKAVGFPMDLVKMAPVSGKELNERGYTFFREDKAYQLDAPDANGIVRVYSQCWEVGPDEDGYGAMEYFDWWMLDTNLEPIPGVEMIHGYSAPNLFGTSSKEIWNKRYAIALEVLKNRK